MASIPRVALKPEGPADGRLLSLHDISLRNHSAAPAIPVSTHFHSDSHLSSHNCSGRASTFQKLLRDRRLRDWWYRTARHGRSRSRYAGDCRWTESELREGYDPA